MTRRDTETDLAGLAGMETTGLLCSFCGREEWTAAWHGSDNVRVSGRQEGSSCFPPVVYGKPL